MKITQTCYLYISSTAYIELNASGKELFEYDETQNLYYTSFPAEIETVEDLKECIIAFIEVSLISLNDKYGVQEDTKLSGDIFYIQGSKHLFTLIMTIKYGDDDTLHNEMLNFETLPRKDDTFAFKLLGDQTMFSMEHTSS